ncbi:uncharacterized protein LOC134540860 isoform X1 [Bacillus rossius redtenbacheri]|uniref:uncharacterized protein LOC134540860 isoform X1 n=1 Tax=Bacillus rossius redtenbacheri TaxID=93214 RepID=UPI002FDEA57B
MWPLLALVFLAGALVLLRRRDPEPVLGVYRQPGAWYPLKYALVRVMLYLRKRKSLRDAARRGDQQVGYGQTRHRSIDEMEVAQPLSEHAKAFDAVFFIGTSADGCYFVLGAERRKHGIVNGLCYLMTPNTGLLCSSKLPDTVLFEAQDDQFGAEGVSAAMLQPMRKWRAQFDGDMRSEARPGELHRVRIDVTFSSEWPHFNFDTDLHPAVLCRALAREPWSRRYFDNLKNAHQTHYEQMGFIDGTADIDGRVVQLQMQGFRDHSYGDKRDWELMHRYSFHMLFLESGLRATIGVICQPCTGSAGDGVRVLARRRRPAAGVVRPEALPARRGRHAPRRLRLPVPSRRAGVHGTADGGEQGGALQGLAVGGAPGGEVPHVPRERRAGPCRVRVPLPQHGRPPPAPHRPALVPAGGRHVTTRSAHTSVYTRFFNCTNKYSIFYRHYNLYEMLL